MNEMVDAISKEILWQKNYLDAPLETIYFGGGTPSILPITSIEKILSLVYKNYSIADNPEITLEANPDDIDIEKLTGWKANGINRLSIGTQSFHNEDLQWMNRAHNANQAITSIQLAQQTGFTNITIDIIYGTPKLSNEKWIQNIQTAISLDIPHLSCYALTVEPRTALQKFIKKKKIADVNQLQQARQFEILMEYAEQTGFEHYEISNFAKPGFRSLHNSNYWSGNKYLGVGPGAHSFNESSRQWNISNNALYLQSIAQGTIPFETEILTTENKINEYIMTSLRTSEGLNLNVVKTKFGNDILQHIISFSSKWISKSLLIQKENFLTLTKRGKLMADGIAADLFVD